MPKPYQPVPRNTDGTPSRGAGPTVLTDLSNIHLWKDLLCKSGVIIDEIQPPEVTHGLSTYEAWHNYQARRARIIRNELTNSQIGNYCRKYEIRMHGRLCPSFF